MQNIEELKNRLKEIQRILSAFTEGGDRPPSPPATLMLEELKLKKQIFELTLNKQKE